MISWDVILGAVVAAALTAYLIYAMLRAEKF
jgi:K+-transporting ATPase KdpF subunit